MVRLCIEFQNRNLTVVVPVHPPFASSKKTARLTAELQSRRWSKLCSRERSAPEAVGVTASLTPLRKAEKLAVLADIMKGGASPSKSADI